MSNSSNLGIMTWATSIRLNMANDPGRQYVEDQIQEHGFKFLDDYLATVLEGPKEDAVIELLKTPGRRKDAHKRTRAAAATVSRMQSVINMSDLTEDDKENGSSNRLMQDLLQAQASKDDDTYNQPIPHASLENPFVPESAPKTTSRKPKSVTIASPPPAPGPSRANLPTQLMPVLPSQLSAISEEGLGTVQSSRSRSSDRPSANQILLPTNEKPPAIPRSSSSGLSRDKPRSSGSTRHSKSFSRGSQERARTPAVGGDVPPVHPIEPPVHAAHSPTPPAGKPRLPTPIENPPAVPARYPTPSPEPVPPVHSEPTIPHQQQPIASSSSFLQEAPVPSRTPAQPPRPLSRQASVPAQITVPVAFSRSSTAMNFSSMATPGAAPAIGGAGKRTSWLRKVRESKPAIDLGKRMSAAPGSDTLAHAAISAHPAPVRVGSKRTSGEMLAGAPDEEAPRRKSQRLVEPAHTSNQLPARSAAAPKNVPVMRDLATDDDPVEDSMANWSDAGEDGTESVHTFRRVMQGLNALKGKSLGGETLVANEARVATDAVIRERANEEQKRLEAELQAKQERDSQAQREQLEQERRAKELAEQEARRLKQEKRAKEEAELHAKQEVERLAREAQLAKLQEENRLANERARKAEEERQSAERKRQAAEAELRRIELERRRKEDDERKAEEQRELERLRAEAEEEKRLKDEAAREEELRQQEETERQRRLQRQRQAEELERRRQEEREAQERKRKEEERRRKASIERKRQEEERDRQAEQARQEEEERRQREAAEAKARQQEAERIRAKEEQDRRIKDEADKRRMDDERRERTRREAEERAREERTKRERAAAAVNRDHHNRLSTSDLVTTEEAHGSMDSSKRPSVNASISTTPPDSPPARAPLRLTAIAPAPGPAFRHPPSLGAGGVFSKPKPVFSAPPRTDSTADAGSNNFAAKAKEIFQPPSKALSKPSVVPHQKSFPASKESTKSSFEDDSLFDAEERPDVLPHTQGTDYSATNTQPGVQFKDVPIVYDDDTGFNDFDEDASWRVERDLSDTGAWRRMFAGSRTTDDTWSTTRTQSQKGDTGNTRDLAKSSTGRSLRSVQEQLSPPDAGATSRSVPGTFHMEVEEDEGDDGPLTGSQEDDNMDLDSDEPDLKEMAAAGKSTITLVKKTQPPASDDSQMGLFGQASKLVTNMFGGGKKVKPEPIKSVQLAHVAAKRQQDDKEKQSDRLKTQEARRQQVKRRKEEAKARQLEDERKAKEEDMERRKREREENTDKRPLKLPTKKGGDDDTKKKLLASSSTLKKPPSKDKPPTAIIRPAVKPKAGILKQPSSSTLNASYQFTMGASTTSKPAAAPTGIVPPAAAKGKAKAKDQAQDERPPAMVLQKQMQDRAKAQMKASLPPRETSENIELPDIASEYSDSDDEDRKAFAGPDWAASPELASKLQAQAGLNPDDIFGAIQPLQMEEIFRGRAAKFRSRTSSANWAGTDQLTAEEEVEYAKRMGYK